MDKNDQEEWKTVSGFSSYEISNKGNIRSLTRKKKLKNGKVFNIKGKPRKIRKHPGNGFFMTDLVDDKGKRRTVYPHKLVASAFVPNPTPRKRKVVIHIDGNFQNNVPENLKWATFSESIRYGFEIGKRDNGDLWRKRRAKYGPSGGNSAQGRPDPLNEDQKKELYKLRSKGETLQKLADKFGCSVSHVHKTHRVMKEKLEK